MRIETQSLLKDYTHIFMVCQILENMFRWLFVETEATSIYFILFFMKSSRRCKPTSSTGQSERPIFCANIVKKCCGRINRRELVSTFSNKTACSAFQLASNIPGRRSWLIDFPSLL